MTNLWIDLSTYFELFPSYCYQRILFPELPVSGAPLHIYPKDFKHAPISTNTEEVNEFLQQHSEQDFIG